MFPMCSQCRRPHDPAGACEPLAIADAEVADAAERQAEADFLENERIRQYVLRWRWRDRPAA